MYGVFLAESSENAVNLILQLDMDDSFRHNRQLRYCIPIVWSCLSMVDQAMLFGM